MPKVSKAESKAFPKLKIDKMLRATENYSPYGLCRGALVRSNGKRSETVGCWAGGLILAAAPKSKRGYLADKAIVNDHGGPSNLSYTEDNKIVDGEDMLAKGYGLTEDVVAQGVSFNDHCLTRAGKPRVARFLNSRRFALVPPAVKRQILRLRQRHERFLKSKAFPAWEKRRAAKFEKLLAAQAEGIW